MELEDFTARASALWEALPQALREGITHVEVFEAARYDAEFEGVPLLGECIPDPLGALVGEGPVRSSIALYYGSFVVVAAREPGFDWAYELDETLMHELRHHLDWRQGHDTLGVEDDLQREDMLRRAGRPFLPHYYRAGRRVGASAWEVDGVVFVEVQLTRAQWDTLTRGLTLRWRGLRVDLAPRAAPPASPLYVDDAHWQVEGASETPERADEAVVVLRRVWFWARNAEVQLTLG